MSRRILFIAPHPDDETLGCGGAILRHKALGDSLYWLIITKAFEEDGFASTAIKAREQEIEEVARRYGFAQTFRLNLRAIALDTYPIKDIVRAIGDIIQKTQAQTIYVPNASDVHTDHDVVFKAAWSCSKTFRYPTVGEVYVYETLSETEFAAPYSKNSFMPNTFMDITPHMEEKIEIMHLYQSEVAAHPFPRSTSNINALATLRGAQVGVPYAEAFVCLKRIIAS